MSFAATRRVLPALLLLALCPPAGAAGPKVPEGFECRLVASVPAVLYPCQVATAPDGSLFVAEDPMDQVGPYEAYHGAILRFREGHDPAPFADGFRAIQGMAWYEGTLYVCHMPFLSVLRDTDGDGKADERKDLFKDLGPTNNAGLNDHIVSGIQLGMDGWLYISVGDKGIPSAHGPDGRTLQIKGGGVVRCRPDGTGIEIVTYGTRNHLEANLNDRDEIFTYDNTDDGDGWWTRVTHHVDGGYYGYPYDYHEYQYRMLPRMAEYGGGSPCGAVIYKEDVWPEKYRNVGFWSEWGKGKVHAFRFAPEGATFKIAEEIDFAVPDGVENFKPIDNAVSYDGRTMYIADWNMGGWGSKTEKVGRIWAVTYKGDVKTRPRGSDADPADAQVRQLDHPSFNERMRAQRALIRKGREVLGLVDRALADPGTDPVAKRHLIWTLDGIAGGTPEATAPILEQLKSSVADLRTQAARALGQRRMPTATGPLVALLKDPEPAVRLQAVIALGRIGDGGTVPALLPMLADSDVYLSFSARQALRRIGAWKATAAGLASTDPKVRAGVLMTLELVYAPEAAAALAEYAAAGGKPAEERAKALLYLATVHRKAKPWNGAWWGTRPSQGKQPEKVDAWEGTARVLDALRGGLADGEALVRASAVQGVKETGDKAFLPALRERFRQEPDAGIRRSLALTLGGMDDKEALPLLVAALGDTATPEPVREASLTAVEMIGGELAVKTLVDVLGQADLAADRKPRVIAALGKFKAEAAIPGLVAALASPAAPVRAAAAEALGKIGKLDPAASGLRAALADPDAGVRKAALGALAALKDRESIPAFLAAADKEETRFEASLALAALPDVRSLQVYLRGLVDKSQELRKSSSTALGAIRDEAAPILDQLAKRNELAPASVSELVKIYTALQPIAQWRTIGPFPLSAKPPINPEGTIDLAAEIPASGDKLATWKITQAIDPQGQVDLGKAYTNSNDLFAFGYAEVNSAAGRKAQMAVGSDDTLTVWVNGKQVYDFADRRGYAPDTARFDVTLNQGTNRILIKCANMGGPWQYSLALSSPGEYAFLKDVGTNKFDPEAYREFALKAKGNAEHGRALFADVKGLACVKCHAVKGQGGTVGPDLSSVGGTYPRDELIASVLYPSRKIFSGYEPIVVATADGRVLTGILKADTAEGIEIQDADANRIKLRKDEIDERKTSDVSIMPSGLAEGLSKDDFADVIAFLESLKDKPAEKK